MRSCQLRQLNRRKSKAHLSLVVISEKNISFQQRSFLTRGCTVEEEITPLKSKPDSHFRPKPVRTPCGQCIQPIGGDLLGKAVPLIFIGLTP